MAIYKNLNGIWCDTGSNTPLYLDIVKIDDKISMAQQEGDKYWVIINQD